MMQIYKYYSSHPNNKRVIARYETIFLLPPTLGCRIVAIAGDWSSLSRMAKKSPVFGHRRLHVCLLLVPRHSSSQLGSALRAALSVVCQTTIQDEKCFQSHHFFHIVVKPFP